MPRDATTVPEPEPAPPRDDDLVRAYLAGESISAIQKRFDIGPGVLYGALKRAGIKPNRPMGRPKEAVEPDATAASEDVVTIARREHLAPETVERMQPLPNGVLPPGPERDRRIVALYQQGVATKDILADIGVSYASVVYDALKRAGVQVRPGPRPRAGAGAAAAAQPPSTTPPAKPVPAPPEPMSHEQQQPSSSAVAGEAGDSTAADAPADALGAVGIKIIARGDVTPPPQPDLVRYQVVTERVIRDVLIIDARDFDDAVKQAHRIDGVTEIVSVSRMR